MGKTRRVRFTQPRGVSHPTLGTLPTGNIRDFARYQPALWKGWLNKFVTNQLLLDTASQVLCRKVTLAELQTEADHWQPYAQLKTDAQSRDWAVLAEDGTIVVSTWSYGKRNDQMDL